MQRFPNWTWTPSRFGAERLSSDGLGLPAAARPCLPSIEKLDPRTLFSVSVSDITIVKHVDKSTPTLLVAESQVLAPLQGAGIDSNYKGQATDLGNDFLKLNDILLKYESDILSQKVSPNEGADVTQKINDLFLKIQDVALKLDGGTGTLLPAVQNVLDLAAGAKRGENAGPSILTDLNALAGQLKLSPLPGAEADVLIKMAGDFYKLSEVALKYTLDLIHGVPTDVAQKQAKNKEREEYLKITLETVLVSGFISEGDQNDLNNLANGALDAVNGVINPITIDVGPTVPGGTGDTIV